MNQNNSQHQPSAAPAGALTVRQACERLQICRTTLYGLIRAGRIRTVAIGKRGVRVPASEIERFVGGA